MPEVSPSRYLVQAGWDDVPHLNAKTKAELLDSTPPYLRDARSKGIPGLGAGAIYPVAESEIIVDPFVIPAYWRRGYGMDVGWNRTAAIWGAQDPTDGVIYAHAEHYMGQALPVVHATAIKGRGEWIKGAIDPASRSAGQDDGKKLLAQYRSLGLKLTEADNAVETGLHLVWSLLSTGRLKLFRTLQNTLAEYRIYRRDEKGKIVKANDHLMDALRYMIMTWAKVASTRPMAANDLEAAFQPLDPKVAY